jgi:hypothetical protein
MNNLKIVLSGLTKEQMAQINAQERLSRISQLATTDVKRQGKEISALRNDARAASRGMNTFAATLEYTTERFIQIGVVLLTIRKIRQAISDMITNISELDKALVELQKVTDLSGSSLETFTNRAYNAGEELARTGKEVIDATTLFSRAGYEIQDAFELSKTALLLTNVADGIDNITDASSTLISVLKAFKMEASDSIHIVDALNAVSNNFALDTDNLAEILQRVSGTLEQTGTTMEEVIGLSVGGFTTLRNAEMVASGEYFCQYVQKCA